MNTGKHRFLSTYAVRFNHYSIIPSFHFFRGDQGQRGVALVLTLLILTLLVVTGLEMNRAKNGMME